MLDSLRQLAGWLQGQSPLCSLKQNTQSREQRPIVDNIDQLWNTLRKALERSRGFWFTVGGTAVLLFSALMQTLVAFFS